MSHFDWSDCVVENLLDLCLLTESRKLMTVENWMYLMKFCELLARQCYYTAGSGELKFTFGTHMFVYLIILNATSQIYKSWSLHDSNPARTGASCITQNQKDWRGRKLNHKQSWPTGTGRPATTFEFSEIYNVLKIITNVAAVVYRVLDQQRLF